MPLLTRTLLGVALVAAIGLAVRPLSAQDTLRIVALVNDEAITAIDLSIRTRITMVSAGLPDTPEVRQRLLPQVLRALIDDHLRQKAAEDGGIDVPQNLIDERVARLAESNRMSPDEFKARLQQAGIDPAWIEDQLRTEIGWMMLINRKFRPTVVITDEDIDEAARRLRESQGEPEYRVAEIYLAVNDPGDAEAVRDSAERLMEQLGDGANFAAVARQFSQSATAVQGGLIGWVRRGDLGDDLERAVEQLEPGAVAGPVRSEGGYHILLLVDRRTAGTGEMPSREEISRQLMNDRLELLSRGYLRDLRRAAYVDIRQ
jgi:peptidyl-prolyl cis-trans isomerase SurA